MDETPFRNEQDSAGMSQSTAGGQATAVQGSSSPPTQPTYVLTSLVKPLHAWIIVVLLALLLAVSSANLVVSLVSFGNRSMPVISGDFSDDRGNMPQSSQSQGMQSFPNA